LLDQETCEAMQREEWEVLESIFPDFLSNGSHVTEGQIELEIPVELTEGLSRKVVVMPPDALTQQDSPHPNCNIQSPLSLTTLPPITLFLTLPLGYPLRRPPVISRLHATYGWIPVEKFKLLERTLLRAWEVEQEQDGEGRAILYDWVEMIRSAEAFLGVLGMMTNDNVLIEHPAPTLLAERLTFFDDKTRLEKFSQTNYVCEVCLSSIKGAKCISLGCGHVFCRACLVEFWGLCISEGDGDRIGCPDPGCVKQGTKASEEDVRRVVSSEEVARWKWLKEKKELEKDPTIVHCPMGFCQHPVKKPTQVESGNGWERLRTCVACGYSFCAYCRRTWHGPHTSCPLTFSEGFVHEYMKLEEGSEKRTVLQRRFGKGNLEKLVQRSKEDRANREWLDRSTMACPGCGVRTEKSMGCNHMTCGKCSQHFCYRCGGKLQGSDPYEHFSRKGKPCYRQLFDLDTVRDEWQPVEGFDPGL